MRERERETDRAIERERETDSYLISLWPLGIRVFEVQIILMLFGVCFIFGIGKK